MSRYTLPKDLRCRQQGSRAVLYARKGGDLLESYHADRVAIVAHVAAQAEEIARYRSTLQELLSLKGDRLLRDLDECTVPLDACPWKDQHIEVGIVRAALTQGDPR